MTFVNVEELHPTLFFLQLLGAVVLDISHIDCCLLRESEVPSELSEGSKMLFHSSFIVGLLNIYCNFYFIFLETCLVKLAIK